MTFNPVPKPIKQPKTRKPMKRGTNKNRPNAEELAYMGEVKKLPCCICGKPGPSDAHHPICGRYGGPRNNHMDVIPLCKEDHQHGPLAIHKDKAGWVERNGPDTEYIEQVRHNVALRTHGSVVICRGKGD